MLPVLAIFNFVRAFFPLHLFRCLILGLLFISLLFAMALTPFPVQADGTIYQSEESDPQLNQLHQELVKLQEQDVRLAGLGQLFNAGIIADSSYHNFEDEKAKLGASRGELSGSKVQLEQKVQQLEKRLRNYALAEKVRAATNFSDYRNNFYDRFGYSRGTMSDCTWYAAEAVKLASGGQIDLNDRNAGFGNWGNAGGWAAGASAFAKNNPGGVIIGVDKIPSPGDIIEWPGHVAFVEKVREVRDEAGNLIRYTVTISEEMATGQGRLGSTPVRPNDDENGLVKRWRATLELRVTSGLEVADNLKFIHFDYKS